MGMSTVHEGALPATAKACQLEVLRLDLERLVSTMPFVHEYRDRWRTKLGDDDPSEVEPSSVEPYQEVSRDTARVFKAICARTREKWSLVQEQRDVVGLCRALGEETRQKIMLDYRPVTLCTLPLAGATPNLRAVLMQCVDITFSGGLISTRGLGSSLRMRTVAKCSTS
ncbi:hypothetical protein PsorP6_017280 [Peronosclerospora sorghi]|uniref:Uncharacterized protein n=1 Tax=Peronosclerospora sorghi TaxID=230839 RepID=A0ACC0WLN9_9STRA|nr:hypothetical protein PsorP6_017280 [Peronosclerospora sorghi]